MMPYGYNGTYVITGVTANTFSFALATNPGVGLPPTAVPRLLGADRRRRATRPRPHRRTAISRTTTV